MRSIVVTPTGFATGLKNNFGSYLVGRIGAKRNPPLARETKVGYGFASNPPRTDASDAS
jgi:hypothetical protein